MTVDLPRQRFCDILAKNYKCRRQNRLGAPFVTYEFAWGTNPKQICSDLP